MNEYRNRVTGDVITESVFRSLFPEITLNEVIDLEMLDSRGYDAVLLAYAPIVSRYQTSVRNGVVQSADGNWIYAWLVIDLTEQEIVVLKNKDKANMRERILYERDFRDDSGVLVSGYWFHTDQKSQIRYLALVMAGDGIPEGLLWKTMSGVKVNMTQALAQQVFSSAISASHNVFSIGEDHIAAMLISNDPSTYDYTIGWPDFYKPV